MEGIYPVIIDGLESGSLEVKKDGIFTVFKAKCHMQPGVIRLSVYGEGREGYLGVPVPGDGALALEKKFSPSAMRSFPANIEFVSLAGMEQTKQEHKEEESSPAEDKCEDNSEKPPCETEEELCEEGPFWYASPDGALVSFDGEREMVALSPDDGRVPRNIPGQPRIIEGKEYLVYITKEVGG